MTTRHDGEMIATRESEQAIFSSGRRV